MRPITVKLNTIKAFAPKKTLWSNLLHNNKELALDLSQEIPLSAILKSNGLADTLWILRTLPQYDHLWRSFAWWCAKEVEHIASNPLVTEALEIIQDYYLQKVDDQELSYAWQLTLDALDETKNPATIAACRSACFAASWSAAYSVTEASDYAAEAITESAKSAAWAIAESTTETTDSNAVGRLAERYLSNSAPSYTSKWYQTWLAARKLQESRLSYIIETGQPIL